MLDTQYVSRLLLQRDVWIRLVDTLHAEKLHSEEYIRGFLLPFCDNIYPNIHISSNAKLVGNRITNPSRSRLYKYYYDPNANVMGLPETWVLIYMGLGSATSVEDFNLRIKDSQDVHYPLSDIVDWYSYYQKWYDGYNNHSVYCSYSTVMNFLTNYYTSPTVSQIPEIHTLLKEYFIKAQ